MFSLFLFCFFPHVYELLYNYYSISFALFFSKQDITAKHYKTACKLSLLFKTCWRVCELVCLCMVFCWYNCVYSFIFFKVHYRIIKINKLSVSEFWNSWPVGRRRFFFRSSESTIVILGKHANIWIAVSIGHQENIYKYDIQKYFLQTWSSSCCHMYFAYC